MRKIIELLQTKWHEYLLEIIVIIIGILLAFALNNWSQNRNERIKENEMLRSLQNEFTYNLKIIDEEIQKLNTIQGDLKEFLKFSGPTYDTIAKKEFNHLLTGIQKNSLNFRPAIGVVDDILNSGQLSIISDNELRRKLSKWKVLLDRVYKQEGIVEEHRERIKEITIQHGNLTEHFIQTGFAQANEIDFGKHQFSDPGSTLLQNQTLTNIVLLKFASSTSLLKRYQSIKGEIKTTLDLIEKEL